MGALKLSEYCIDAIKDRSAALTGADIIQDMDDARALAKNFVTFLESNAALISEKCEKKCAILKSTIAAQE